MGGYSLTIDSLRSGGLTVNNSVDPADPPETLEIYDSNIFTLRDITINGGLRCLQLEKSHNVKLYNCIFNDAKRENVVVEFSNHANYTSGNVYVYNCDFSGAGKASVDGDGLHVTEDEDDPADGDGNVFIEILWSSFDDVEEDGMDLEEKQVGSLFVNIEFSGVSNSGDEGVEFKRLNLEMHTLLASSLP